MKNTIPCAHIISKEPLILTSVWDILIRTDFGSMLPQKEKVYILCFLWWSREHRDLVAPIPIFLKTHTEKYPLHKFIFLCNTQAEKQILEKYSLKAVFCSQNAFLDENQFTIIENADKVYDAIYNARLSEWKRHHLARRIKKLAMLAHTTFTPSAQDDNWGKKMRHKVLSHAEWFNDNYGEQERNIPPNDLYQYLNQAKVGLCLSALEGAMYASLEYLLCGLPIVSTRSKGGRDIFFDKDYVKIVWPNPYSVESGVKEMIKRQIPAQLIRNKTLEKMNIHRSIFIELVQDIYDKEGKQKLFSDEFHNVFTSKMLSEVKL